MIFTCANRFCPKKRKFHSHKAARSGEPRNSYGTANGASKGNSKTDTRLSCLHSGGPGGNMTEDEYLAGEFTDAGEHFLEEEGFYHKVGRHRFDA
jgi:hypothetical protein